MRILLVEDNRQLRTAIARGLREEGYAVDLAATGSHALTLTNANEYDAIVLDLLLPDVSGILICQNIRQRGANVPILMLTALDAVEERIAGLDAGADDYLTKPFDFGELLARLRALTRRRGDALPSEVVVGDLVIDTARHRVHRNDRELSLTATEFAFLLHLARNAGRVVSRAELIEHVWDDARNTYSNIIDVYASRLRRKLDDGEDAPMLTTLRGTGFMLDAPVASKARGSAIRKRVGRR